jgi:hypothetical protein
VVQIVLDNSAGAPLGATRSVAAGKVPETAMTAQSLEESVFGAPRGGSAMSYLYPAYPMTEKHMVARCRVHGAARRIFTPAARGSGLGCRALSRQPQSTAIE